MGPMKNLSGVGGAFNFGANKLKNSGGGNSGGVFWKGADGNVYVKGAKGTNSAGRFDANTNNYWQSRGYKSIADPNAPSGGGGGATTNSTLAYGGTGDAGTSSLLSGFMDRKGDILGSARTAAGVGGRQLRGSILDFMDSFKQGQRQVDEAGINSALAKQQGVSGILDMVGRGIRSGGVTLSNKNAGDSSAALGIAQAYGNQGRRQMADVGNQYENKQREIGTMQQDLMGQKTNFERDFKDEKLNIVDNIVEEARSKLGALNEAMMGASLPDRIEIQNEIDAIKQDTLGVLQEYDRMLGQQLGGVKPLSDDQRRAEAAKRATAGYDLGADAFSFTNEVPLEFQDSGPFASEIPLFTFNRGNEDQLG